MVIKKELETQLKQFLEWVYSNRYNYSDTICLSTLFDEIEYAFGKDIFKKLGIERGNK